LKPDCLPDGWSGKTNLTGQNGTCVPRNSGRFSYIVRSLGLEPEHFLSRLARSTCCQRPNRPPPERCVSVESQTSKKPVSSKLAASLSLVGVKRRTLQTYRELLSSVNQRSKRICLFSARIRAEGRFW